MKKSTKIACGIGASAVSAVCFNTVTEFLLGTAFDKEPPRALGLLTNTLKGSKPKDDYRSAREAAAEMLSWRESELVEITGDDGTKLRGHLVRCEEPRRLIIAMHGWRSSWTKDFGLISDFLYDSGCDVLYAEQRAQNGNDGYAMGMGMIEKNDCRRWAGWANLSYGNSLPVYLYGTSMGAATVLMASGETLPDNVHGIIADSAFTSAKAQLRHILKDNFHMEYRLRCATADIISRRKIGMRSDEFTTVEALRSNVKPVMLIHGTADTFVPMEMFYQNYAAIGGEKEHLIIEGAGHCMGYFIDKDAYEKALWSFWDKFDDEQ